VVVTYNPMLLNSASCATFKLVAAHFSSSKGLRVPCLTGLASRFFMAPTPEMRPRLHAHSRGACTSKSGLEKLGVDISPEENGAPRRVHRRVRRRPPTRPRAVASQPERLPPARASRRPFDRRRSMVRPVTEKVPRTSARR